MPSQLLVLGPPQLRPVASKLPFFRKLPVDPDPDPNKTPPCRLNVRGLEGRPSSSAR